MRLGSEPRLGVGNVAANLGAELGQRRKFFFVAEFFDEDDFQFLAVEIAFEIEQVSFDAELGVGVFQGRARQ